MKKLFTLLSLVIALVAASTFAQAADTVQVDVTKLSTDQLKVYQEMKAMQAKSAASSALENFTPREAG